MDNDVEKLVWRQAWQIYGASLDVVLREVLAGYKRSAGYDDLTRLHQSTVGGQALQILNAELAAQMA